MRPAAIVEGHPTPVGLFLVGNPVPAPLLGVDPSPISVRAPSRRQIVWHPDFAEARMRLPRPIGLERRLKFGRHLRIRRRKCRNRHRRGQSTDRDGDASNDRHGQTPQVTNDCSHGRSKILVAGECLFSLKLGSTHKQRAH